MGVKFGEIDATQILDNEFRVGVLEELLEWMVKNNSGVVGPNQETVTQIRSSVLETLQKKYPKSGLSFKLKED